jgi:hypothetical protein
VGLIVGEEEIGEVDKLTERARVEEEENDDKEEEEEEELEKEGEEEEDGKKFGEEGGKRGEAEGEKRGETEGEAEKVGEPDGGVAVFVSFWAMLTVPEFGREPFFVIDPFLVME